MMVIILTTYAVYLFQVFGNLVAVKMSNHEAASSHDNRRNLVHRSDNDVTLVAIF